MGLLEGNVPGPLHRAASAASLSDYPSRLLFSSWWIKIMGPRAPLLAKHIIMLYGVPADGAMPLRTKPTQRLSTMVLEFYNWLCFWIGGLCGEFTLNLSLNCFSTRGVGSFCLMSVVAESILHSADSGIIRPSASVRLVSISAQLFPYGVIV